MESGDDINLLVFSKKKRSSSSTSIKDKEKPDDIPSELTGKKGGWADEGLKLKNKSKNNFIDQERFKIHKIDDSDDDIPVIPDLEDLQEEPIQKETFKPLIPVVSTTTYQELDYEVYRAGNYPLSQAKLKTNKGDISLACLSKYLRPENSIKETNNIWTVDSLWEDISKLNFV